MDSNTLAEEKKLVSEEKKLVEEEKKVLGEEKKVLKQEKKILGMERNYFIAAVVIVAAILVVLVLMSTGGKGSTNSTLTSYDDKPVPSSFLSMLSIPNSVSSAVGMGYAINIPTKVSAANLTSNGKPVVLYVGADYCPYCAFERWALMIALMRFGNFTGIKYMTSSASETPASLPTFTFYNSTYSSAYVDFQSVEESSNTKVPLQSPNNLQTAVLQKFDPNNYIPFVDFANRTTLVGATYADLTILAGRNWTTIANALQNSSTVQSGAIIGSANLLTAEICEATGNKPASVCGASYVTSIEGAVAS